MLQVRLICFARRGCSARRRSYQGGVRGALAAWTACRYQLQMRARHGARTAGELPKAAQSLRRRRTGRYSAFPRSTIAASRRRGRELCQLHHLPESSFADGKRSGDRRPPTHRNAPSLLNAARMGHFIWDGRADSLWSQPLFAVGTRTRCARRTRLAHAVYASVRTAAATKRWRGPCPISANDASAAGQAGRCGLRRDGEVKAAIDRVASNWKALRPARMTAGQSSSTNTGGRTRGAGPGEKAGLAGFAIRSCIQLSSGRCW